ncbi:MAG TPA: amidohydrolase family protein [Gemmatimonadaceae bacterium]|nr:amidohydrolase family protein [Gemmatimonadaceae bacterium]
MRIRLAAAVGALALTPALLHSQIGRAGAELARPTAWAITNARIVPVAGPVIAQGTVVIRDGVIAAVGPSDRTSTPADARRVDGTGLTVYPGLIDAASHLGLPAPRAQQGGGRGAAGGGAAALVALQQAQSGSDDAARSRYPEGLRPEVRTAELLEVDADAFALARGAGITTALSMPRSGILAGQSALVTVGEGSPQDVLLRAPVALHVGFTPIRGAFPNSLLGVFAAVRQMLYDARRYGELHAAYARAPRGMARPEHDPSLAALQPALAREVPVFLQASSQREIERALDLAKEFNLRAVIVGGAEAHRVAARLRAENVPVIATTSYPRAPRETSPDADPEPLRVLRERAEAPRNAARLAEAGVRFAFAGYGLPDVGEFLPGVRRAVEAGLARDRALRALTLDAAELLGVADRLGSVEVGKIANLVVVRGDLLEPGARITHAFVDGRPLEARVAPAGGRTGAAAAADAGASGQWLLTVTLQGQERQITLQLQQEGERLRGSIQGGLGTAQIANGSIGATGEFRFTVSITTASETDEATFAGTVTGGAMRGSVTVVGEDPGAFTGQRGQGRPRGGRAP